MHFSSRNLGISREFDKEIEEHFIQESGETMKKFENVLGYEYTEKSLNNLKERGEIRKLLENLSERKTLKLLIALKFEHFNLSKTSKCTLLCRAHSSVQSGHKQFFTG